MGAGAFLKVRYLKVLVLVLVLHFHFHLRIGIGIGIGMGICIGSTRSDQSPQITVFPLFDSKGS